MITSTEKVVSTLQDSSTRLSGAQSDVSAAVASLRIAMWAETRSQEQRRSLHALASYAQVQTESRIVNQRAISEFAEQQLRKEAENRAALAEVVQRHQADLVATPTSALDGRTLWAAAHAPAGNSPHQISAMGAPANVTDNEYELATVKRARQRSYTIGFNIGIIHAQATFGETEEREYRRRR